MSDPRLDDPRQSDPRFSDPVLRRDPLLGDPAASGTWGWFGGIAVLALIAFLIIVGWNHYSDSAANDNAPPVTTGSTTRPVSPPASTTGSGAMSPQPLTPAPSKSGAQ
jgi:hypothetical protein